MANSSRSWEEECSGMLQKSRTHLHRAPCHSWDVGMPDMMGCVFDSGSGKDSCLARKLSGGLEKAEERAWFISGAAQADRHRQQGRTAS